MDDSKANGRSFHGNRWSKVMLEIWRVGISAKAMNATRRDESTRRASRGEGAARVWQQEVQLGSENF